MSAQQVFDGQTADGESGVFHHISPRNHPPFLHIFLSGDLGGGSVIVKAKNPITGDFVAMAGGEELDSLGMHVIEAASFTGKLELSGATSADLSAVIENPHSADTRVRAEATS